MPIAPQWLTRQFHKVGLADSTKFSTAYNLMTESFAKSNAFGGDNLITFGRQLGFALDPEFLRCFMGAKPDQQELSLVWRVHILHWAARRGLELEGDFVEAACFKGFTARVIASLTNFASLPRTYWLYDRFSTERDDQFMLGHHEGLYDEVVARFSDCPNVRIIRGNIPDVMVDHTPEKVAFLHVDINSVPAEIGTLDVMYDRLSPGALIVLDDYGWVGNYHSQKAAHDAWFGARGKMIVELPTGQGLVIK